MATEIDIRLMGALVVAFGIYANMCLKMSCQVDAEIEINLMGTLAVVFGICAKMLWLKMCSTGMVDDLARRAKLKIPDAS